MRRNTSAAMPLQRIVKVGGLYLDLERSILVTVEDHEVKNGRRTGRVVVCTADDRIRYPFRWYCLESSLLEARVLSPGAGQDSEVLS